jgi:hypothetical protein
MPTSPIVQRRQRGHGQTKLAMQQALLSPRHRAARLMIPARLRPAVARG